MSFTATLGRSRLLAALLLLLPLLSQAQLSLTTSDPNTTTFDNLGPSATATLPAGFVISNATATASVSYTGAGNTTTTTLAAGTTGTGTLSATSSGGAYNFANGVTATATDRAVGFLSAGSYLAPRHLLLQIQNNTGATITDLTVAYDIERYRTGQRPFEWQFYTSPDGTTWTQVNTQAYAAEGTSNVVLNPATTTTKKEVLAGLNLLAGQKTYLRWSYVGTNGATNSHALALDNLVLTPTLAGGTPPAPTTTITTTSPATASAYCVTATDGAPVSVAYTSTGTFTGTFSAQLSDAKGVFADATSNLIGSGASPITATIPAGTASGTGYRIRVVNDAPATASQDNGVNLTVTLAPTINEVQVVPTADQTLATNTSGNALTATPDVPSSIAWFYNTSGTGSFSTAIAGATTATYQPRGSDFATPGTYYVVAQATSTCGSVVGVSAPVKLTLTPAAPAITTSVTSLPSFGSAVVGSTSAAKSFTVGGQGLTGAVTITPPPGFEIRTGLTAFACCAIVLSPTGGTVSSTQIDVRFAPLAAQAYTGTLAVTSPGLGEQDVTVSGTGVAPTYPATVGTTVASAITINSAATGGTIVEDGGSAVTARGVAWGTSPEPTVTGTHTSDGTGAGSFTSSLTGLRPGTVYYVRAYATSTQGTSYGEQVSFPTIAVPMAEEPAVSSKITASAIYPTRALLTLSGGTGAKRLVVVHLNGDVDQDPTDATTYTGSQVFGQGTQLGTGNYVLLAGTADTLTVFGLRANTPYSFNVYDYNDNNTAYAENYHLDAPGTRAFTTPTLPPTLLVEEDFPYAVGTKLTDNGWVAHSGGGSNPILVTATNLTYPRYTPSTGNAAALTGTGEDLNRTFPTVYPRTDVYLAGLVSVSNAPQTTAGDYFLHLGPTAIGSTYRGRIFVRKTAAGTVQFGVSGSSGTAVYTTAEYALNTTYLLLLRYRFDETGNQSDLFVNPDARTNSYRVMAMADASATETANSPTDIGSVALRQGTGSLQVTVDGLTVATAFPISSSGPLPVTLTDFTAEASGRTVQVAWHTASELNADHFKVERSVDAIAFTKLTTVPAAGTSTVAHAYGFTDASLPAGATVLYYRLHQVDADGTSTYSPVRTVTLTAATAGLALFPNPTKQLTTLTGAGPKATVQVFDALGRALTTAIADADGTAHLLLPAGLVPGVYIVRTGTQALRLVIN